MKQMATVVVEWRPARVPLKQKPELDCSSGGCCELIWTLDVSWDSGLTQLAFGSASKTAVSDGQPSLLHIRPAPLDSQLLIDSRPLRDWTFAMREIGEEYAEVWKQLIPRTMFHHGAVVFLADGRSSSYLCLRLCLS